MTAHRALLTLAGVLAALSGCHLYSGTRGGVGADGVTQVVARLLGSAADPDKHDASVTALVAMGPAAIPGLAAGLGDADDEVRLTAVEALGKIGGTQVVEPLVRALDDQSWNVRLNAVQVLGQLRDARAVQPLLDQYARDDDPQVRYECLTSLGGIGDPAATELLVRETANADPYVRMWAMDALCTMGDARASALAVGLTKDPNRFVRAQTLRSCGSALDTPDGQQALIELSLFAADFESSVLARRQLAAAVRRRPDDAQLTGRMRRAGHEALQGEQVTRAALLLAVSGDARCGPQLIAALWDANPLLRQEAAYLIAQVDAHDAVPALIKALADPEPVVAATAYDSLQQFAAAGDARARAAASTYRGKKFDRALER